MSTCRAAIWTVPARSYRYTDRLVTSSKWLLQVEMFSDAYSATKGSHAICVLTEWDEFKQLDYEKIYSEMVRAPWGLVFPCGKAGRTTACGLPCRADACVTCATQLCSSSRKGLHPANKLVITLPVLAGQASIRVRRPQHPGPPEAARHRLHCVCTWKAAGPLPPQVHYLSWRLAPSPQYRSAAAAARESWLCSTATGGCCCVGA